MEVEPAPESAPVASEAASAGEPVTPAAADPAASSAAAPPVAVGTNAALTTKIAALAGECDALIKDVDARPKVEH
jgi:hypothetical protein